MVNTSILFQFAGASALSREAACNLRLGVGKNIVKLGIRWAGVAGGVGWCRVVSGGAGCRGPRQGTSQLMAKALYASMMKSQVNIGPRRRAKGEVKDNPSQPRSVRRALAIDCPQG
jgi:hypothetical protein